MSYCTCCLGEVRPKSRRDLPGRRLFGFLSIAVASSRRNFSKIKVLGTSSAHNHKVEKRYFKIGEVLFCAELALNLL